jgi:hypothetical protein
MSGTAVERTPDESIARAMRCARSLRPPASSPMKTFTLRVNSTSPAGISSPLVFASAPSTRCSPNACASASFFHNPF